MCEIEEGEEVPVHLMGIGQSVSQGPGGKQDQDTGDLFFICTSLTRYPVQVLCILKLDVSSSLPGWISCTFFLH